MRRIFIFVVQVGFSQIGEWLRATRFVDKSVDGNSLIAVESRHCLSLQGLALDVQIAGLASFPQVLQGAYQGLNASDFIGLQ